MEYIVIGLAVLQMCKPSCQMTIKSFDDILISTIDPLDEELQSNISTRRVQEYMQNQILEQNQALWHLLQLGRTNAVLIKKLIKRCRPFIERLEMPDKTEIFLPNRRSNSHDKTINNEETNRPKKIDIDENTPIISIIKFGKRMPKVGKLFLDVISNEVSYQIEQISDAISSTEVNAM